MTPGEIQQLRERYSAMELDGLADLWLGGELSREGQDVAGQVLAARTGGEAESLSQLQLRVQAWSDYPLQEACARWQERGDPDALACRELERRRSPQDEAAPPTRRTSNSETLRGIHLLLLVLIPIGVLLANFCLWVFGLLAAPILWRSPLDGECQKEGYWYASSAEIRHDSPDEGQVQLSLDCKKWYFSFRLFGDEEKEERRRWRERQ